jgi:DNA-binding transcriptional regulator PaaX
MSPSHKLTDAKPGYGNKTRMIAGDIARLILATLAVSGVVAAAVTCPNLAQLVPEEFRRRYPPRLIKQAVVRLDKRGWIVARQTGQGWKLSVTRKGQAELLAYELGQKHFKKPPHWDQKWRLLMFDIPEKRKIVRNKVRHFLSSFGFQRLQDSVWVYPYDCREVLDLLRVRYGIRAEALYVCAESVDNDRWLRRHFELKSS